MNSVGKGKYEPLIDDHNELYNETDVYTTPVAPGKRVSWDHIKNLDQFFSDIYEYHQHGGFNVLLLAQILWILKFSFVLFIGIELTMCTNWTTVTNHSLPVQNWNDVFIPPNQCWSSLPFSASLVVVGAVSGLILQIFILGMKLQRLWEIRRFCTNILNMPTTDTGLSDLTWSEVQSRLLQSQRDFQLCVYKLSLDQLDIYNRILRHTNYLIAMINQDIIPLRFRLPFDCVPQYVYLSDGYLFNLKLILFQTPWSPFHNYWQLRADYKWVTKRQELASQLASRIRILGLINLLLSPIIFIAQLLTFACANAERMRYQPGTLFGRRWSNYARLYLRHFNELQHEFVSRVSQAYIPASKYLDSFTSRTLAVIVETGAFVFGGVSLAFFITSLFHDQMMHLPGFLAILVLGGILAKICFTLIPDENVVYCPRTLLISTLTRIHYMPDHWKDNAGTSKVRSEFSQLFQYRMVGLVEELLSPFITPILLIFVLSNHTLEIIDFLRNYTVEVPGVGDVCSFAQLDIRRHGDPIWQTDLETDRLSNTDEHGDSPTNQTRDQPYQTSVNPPLNSGSTVHQIDPTNQTAAAGCKTELSLVHFHLTNPSWPLPPDRLAFLKSVRQHALMDLKQQQQKYMMQLQNENKPENVVGSTPDMFSTLYGDSANITSSIYQGTHAGAPNLDGLKNVSHLPGPAFPSENSYGVVGAMVESMRSSITQSVHRTDTTMNKTDHIGPNILRPGHDLCTDSKHTEPSGRAVVSTENAELPFRRMEPTMTTSQLNANVFNYSMLDGPTPVTMSLMAASALRSAENASLPFYQPYNSQTEDVLCHQLGITSSRQITDFLTADMSVSALYIQELYHRRRQQLQNQTSGRSYNSQRNMIDSTPGIQLERYNNLSQTSNTPGVGVYTVSSVPSYQIPTSSLNYPRSYNSRISTERTGVISSNVYTYGAGEPGVVRTPSNVRRLPNTQFADVKEEEEINIGTPKPFHQPFITPNDESHIIRHPSGHSNAGIVTLSGSSSIRPQTVLTTTNTDHEITPGVNITSDHDVWPDLPPTNC